MKKPQLSELAHYAEIAAAIAVVISLVYVGRQVQDNTAAIRSSTMQAVADAFVNVLNGYLSGDQGGSGDNYLVAIDWDTSLPVLWEPAPAGDRALGRAPTVPARRW